MLPWLCILVAMSADFEQKRPMRVESDDTLCTAYVLHSVCLLSYRVFICSFKIISLFLCDCLLVSKASNGVASLTNKQTASTAVDNVTSVNVTS